MTSMLTFLLVQREAMAQGQPPRQKMRVRMPNTNPPLVDGAGPLSRGGGIAYND
jgi:hypothetical protein